MAPSTSLVDIPVDSHVDAVDAAIALKSPSTDHARLSTSRATLSRPSQDLSHNPHPCGRRGDNSASPDTNGVHGLRAGGRRGLIPTIHIPYY